MWTNLTKLEEIEYTYNANKGGSADDRIFAWREGSSGRFVTLPTSTSCTSDSKLETI